ncbi:glycosyl hydrolase [Maribacter halichondriae]|uniref:glycosyl hydrolase n=1 Tax=Maribacter halichondriae TaxID=2980554 RepID=UPI0023591C94|nr:glycosyl hydrolase [Maribacter sp. Hal144]
MRLLLPLFMVFLFVSCDKQQVIGADQSPNEDNATSQESSEESLENTGLEGLGKEDILAYFDTLIANEQVIVGQHCGDAPNTTASFYNTYVDMLADITGRHVGIIGADFGWYSGTEYPVQTLADHWNEGGLVTVSWHADNPFEAGIDIYWNTVENKDNIDLRSLLKDAAPSTARTSYRTELDNVAGGLQKLRDAGVTVIWRPFHEMNGDFFWWGIDTYNNQQTNEADYKELWMDLYNTLIFDYGLDNLIWTYSVVPDRGWNADVTSFYPGSDYVDLVGMDYYGVNPDFPDYDALKSLGKTIVMSESGPIDSGYGNWDMMQHVNALKGKAAYFLQWHSWNGAAVAIKDNKNSIEMMNSDDVITLDELLSNSF